MKKTIITALLIGLWGVTKAQHEIVYEVSFPNLAHNEAEIKITIPNVSVNEPLQVRFARSSPGRYATHEFGKNVYNFKAFDGNGQPLALNQPAGDVFEIKNPSAITKITYTLFGDRIDGTYTGFDETHAHMNIPATFAFPIGMDSRPRIVKFNHQNKPDWKVATQLKPLANGTYYAKDFQYFMDSPIELSAYRMASWEVKNTDGKTQYIHLQAHSEDNEIAVFNFANRLKKMVAEQKAVWGEFPVFEEGHYYFILCAHPSYAGDGMEHRNSTIITRRTPRIEGYENNMFGVFSHEFFHIWNVERLRPKSLEPFDFTQSNISEALWIAEGFTQYYGNLTLKRADLVTLQNILANFSNLVNTSLNSPGGRNYSPVQSSRYAVFADAAVAIDRTNKHNIFASYYTYGSSVALALDLRLRASFNLTLDDYMRALWKAHGKTEVPYTLPDLEKTLAELTKNPSFAKNFFSDFIQGTKKENYEELLLNAGLVLRKAAPGETFSGIGRLSLQNKKVTVPPTLAGTPAYLAGLDADDILLTAGGIEIKTPEDFEKATKLHKPGETIEIKYIKRGIEKTTQLTFTENPTLEIVPIENTGGTITSAMKAFREKWLNSQVKQ